METTKRGFGKAALALVAAALAAVVVFGLSGCGETSSADSADVDPKYADLDSVTLILADNTAKDTAGNLWAQAIADNAKEITGGKLNVDYHGNSELGGDTDLLRQEQSNDIQMVVCQPAPMVSFISDLAVFDLPMAFSNYTGEQIDTVLNGDNDFTQSLQSSYEASGFHNLGWLQNATYRETTSNKNLATLDDFKSFQIRTMENSNHMAFWSAIGAEPTPLAWSEVYFALQNGTVDGQENSTDACVGASLQEVQDYLCMTHHILYANNVSINKEAWDSLDPAYQEALEQAIAEATEEIAPQLSEVNESNIAKMQEAGCEVIEYDDAFFETILSNADVQALYSDIDSKTNGLGQKMLDALAAAQ